MIKSALENAFTGDQPPSPQAVSSLLQDAIKKLDDGLTQDLVKLFPEEPEELEKLSPGVVRHRIMSKSENVKTVVMCMEGSTVLVSLTDPGARNLWVASLGDCRAGGWHNLTPHHQSSLANAVFTRTVLGTRKEDGSWDASIVSFEHKATNPIEVEKMRTEHPLEDEIVVRDRVLGPLQVTRGVL